MQNYFIGIAVIFFGGLISLLIKNRPLKLKFISATSVIGAILALCAAINCLIVPGTSSFFMGFILGNVRFSLDPLSSFFVIVISIMSALGIIYANGYLKPYIEKGKDISAHCVFLPVLFASMLGVVGCQSALMFLIIWELMSLSSFFLVIFEHENPKTLDAGIKYLVYMHLSVIFIIILFATIMTLNGMNADFASFREVLNSNAQLANLAFILAFIGFGIKAGFVPFHNWLPDAHPAAPSHVSGIMSGVMIKTGIYGILRVLSFIDEPSCQIGYFVLIISVISALYGVLYAIGQHDLKRLLAYHSIENIGIIGIGIGVGMLGLAYQNNLVAILGFSGGILHILNHSIFKELLFLAAGSVYTKTHTRDIETLGGLIKSMPKTALLFLIGSIAICGLPPFNGFISEFLIYFGMLKGLMVNNFSSLMGFLYGLAGLALVGTMAILCFTKAFSIIFLGVGRSEAALKPKEDTTISFIFPMALLALFTLIIGLFPLQTFAFMMNPVSVFVEPVDLAATAELMRLISLSAFGLILLIAVLYSLKTRLYSKHQTHSTWGCGYNKPTARMQYSASSYASPFIKTLTPLFKRVVDIKRPKAVFETEAHYSQHVEDVEEAYFLKPAVKSIEKFFAKFEKIQNGNIQNYIMYGIIFLVAALIGVVLLG